MKIIIIIIIIIFKLHFWTNIVVVISVSYAKLSYDLLSQQSQ